MEINKTKRCITCREEKPLEEFGLSRNSRDGHRKQCAICAKAQEDRRAAKKNQIVRFWECDIIAKPLKDYDREESERLREKRARERQGETVSWD